MVKRSSQLSFIIGLFFILVALILLAGYLFSKPLRAGMNLYAGLAFLAFGTAMLFVKEE